MAIPSVQKGCPWFIFALDSNDIGCETTECLSGGVTINPNEGVLRGRRSAASRHDFELGLPARLEVIGNGLYLGNHL
jgi:hypothetical protein